MEQGDRERDDHQERCEADRHEDQDTDCGARRHIQPRGGTDDRVGSYVAWFSHNNLSQIEYHTTGTYMLR